MYLIKNKINLKVYLSLQIALIISTILTAIFYDSRYHYLTIFELLIIMHQYLFFMSVQSILEKMKGRASFNIGTIAKVVLKTLVVLIGLFVLSLGGNALLIFGVFIYIFQLIILIISIKRV